MDRNVTILKIFEYWQSKLAGNRLPSRADILPGELRELLPFLFMADVTKTAPMGTGIHLRLAGTHIGRALGLDLTGCPVGGIAKHWRDFTVGRDLFEAAGQRCAIVSTHEFRDSAQTGKTRPEQQHPAYLRYHRVVLPLASDGRHVDRIMGALVAESYENTAMLWQGPYEFNEQSRRILSLPRCLGLNAMASRAHRAPA
jgi:hypothetical protein